MSATQLQEKLKSLALIGRDASPTPKDWAAGLKIQPLKQSDNFTEANFPRTYLTPALGVEFGQSVKLKEVLALPKEKRDEAVRDIAIEISHNGVAFFRDQQELVPQDLAELALLLGELSGKPNESTLHIHPTQELDESGVPLGKIDNVPTKDGRQISFPDPGVISKGWHTDVPFEPFPSAYTILRMHTLPPNGGDTLWSSAYAFYDHLSPYFKNFLEGLTAVQDANRFREQARSGGYNLRTAPRGHPENAGDDFFAIHPVIRTNPVTGLKGLFVNKTFTKRILEVTEDESDAILAYLFKVQHESADLFVKFKWRPTDVAIWDNRCVNHLATFDYTAPRQGDRAVVVGEKPYFDPASISRKEFLRTQQA